MDEDFVLGAGLIALAVILIAVFIYFYTRLQLILNLIRQENRTMPPGQVWLMLIPCFGTIWRFIVVDRISQSLRNEFNQRGIYNREAKPTNTNGMLYSGFSVAGSIPYLGILFTLVALVFFVIYWSQIEQHIKTLKLGQFETETLDSPMGYIED